MSSSANALLHVVVRRAVANHRVQVRHELRPRRRSRACCPRRTGCCRSATAPSPAAGTTPRRPPTATVMAAASPARPAPHTTTSNSSSQLLGAFRLRLAAAAGLLPARARSPPAPPPRRRRAPAAPSDERAAREPRLPVPWFPLPSVFRFAVSPRPRAGAADLCSIIGPRACSGSVSRSAPSNRPIRVPERDDCVLGPRAFRLRQAAACSGRCAILRARRGRGRREGRNVVRDNDSGEGMGGNAGKGDAGSGRAKGGQGAKGVRTDWTRTVCTAIGITFLERVVGLGGPRVGVSSPAPTPLQEIANARVLFLDGADAVRRRFYLAHAVRVLKRFERDGRRGLSPNGVHGGHRPVLLSRGRCPFLPTGGYLCARAACASSGWGTAGWPSIWCARSPTKDDYVTVVMILAASLDCQDHS